ncbi:3-hydroxybenzoate 6-monooxygenase [Streptomyces sp. ODS05-4]|uniref:3-hydroxybenzoate 6-monooxygenase n=1 Tax=Streptomyces sp. ODS05-4 TaxID=2944939 RepID=UPI00210BDE0B|nr:3-hydroxybenzoate 6-monooxygenase [Streptomyces sp. ODS05-4]
MARIIVAGGGIGGLAAALGVAAQGHHVTVLERRSAFEELGAGIQLGPNAFWALDRLGVGEGVRAQAVFIDELRLMDGTSDACLARMPLTDAYRARFGNPYAVVHRGDLYEALLSACRAAPGVTLTAGAAVTGYTQDAAGVTVALAGGETLTGDALIGADGIRSVVRAQLVGDGDPRVSGHTIYRSVIPIEKVPEDLRFNAVTLWAGPAWHVVHYTIGGGRFLNLAATRDDGATVPVAGDPAERDRVLAEFPGLGDVPRKLLELAEEWRTWVLCDRDPVGTWTDGRVALLGDAAHPMLQYAAQGACMALEDAVVLGRLLDRETGPDTVATRLEKYAAERRDRTAEAQLVAREMGRQLYHAAGDAARARDAMLAALSESDLHGKVDWLHGFRDADGSPEEAAAAAAPR